MVPLRLYLSYTLFVVIKLWDKKSHLYSEIEKKKFTTKLTIDTVNSDFPILLMVPLI